MSTWIIVLVLLVLVLLGLLAVWVRLLKKYDYNIRVREYTSENVRLVYDTPACVTKDAGGKVDVLKLLKPPSKEYTYAPLPPSEAIDYDPKRRKKVAEVWFNVEEGYTYISDSGKVKGYQPLQQTTFHTRKPNHVGTFKGENPRWQEHIPMIVGMSSLVLIILIVFLFWVEAVHQ